MIMVSDLTLYNYTRKSEPTWMRADNYGSMLSQSEDNRRANLLRKIRRTSKH